MKCVVVVLSCVALLVATDATRADAENKPAPGSGAVPVSAGTTASGIDAVLDASGSISGRLVDKATGKPVRDIVVTAFGRRLAVGSSVGSDQSGRFAITGLPASKAGYVICAYDEVDPFEKSNYAAQCFPQAFFNRGDGLPPNSARVPLGAQQNKNIGDIALYRGGTIRGHVTAPSGKRLGRVGVVARSLSYPYLKIWSNGGTHSREGTYFDDALPPSPKGWQVCFYGPGATPIGGGGSSHHYLSGCYQHPVRVEPGTTTRHVNGSLTVAGSIAGKLTSASTGKPVDAAEIDVFNGAGHRVEYTSSNQRGAYTADGLHPNVKYRVCVVNVLPSAQPPAGYIDECYGNVAYSAGSRLPAEARTVHVRRAHTTSRINIALHAGATINGTVGSATSGKPVRARIVVFNAKGIEVWNTASASDGTFRFTNLRASSAGLLICATAVTGDRDKPAAVAPVCGHDVAWDGAATNLPQSALRVKLKAQQHKHGIDLVMPRAGGITGTVTSDATGNPLLDSDIEVYDATGELVEQDVMSDESTGRYQISGLEPSSDGYLVCFSGNAHNSSEQKRFAGQCYDGAAWPH